MPAGFRRLRAERALFAVADRLHALSLDPEVLKIAGRRIRPLLAEGEVVLVGPAVVAVAFDREALLRAGLEKLRHLAQGFAGLAAEFRAVEIEVDPGKIFRSRRLGRRPVAFRPLPGLLVPQRLLTQGPVAGLLLGPLLGQFLSEVPFGFVRLSPVLFVLLRRSTGRERECPARAMKTAEGPYRFHAVSSEPAVTLRPMRQVPKEIALTRFS